MRLRQLYTEAPNTGTLSTGSSWASDAFGGVNQAINKPWELIEPEAGAAGAGGAVGTGSSAGGAARGGATGSGAGSTRNASAAMSFFQRRGLTTAQAAGLVGNLQAESGANLDPRAVGDGGRAIGIAQWHPDRRANFSRAIGKPFERSTFEDQLNFIWWEFNNTERAAFAQLRRATTAEQAAAIVDQYYERSSGAHRNRRIANAAALAGGAATA